MPKCGKDDHNPPSFFGRYRAVLKKTFRKLFVNEKSQAVIKMVEFLRTSTCIPLPPNKILIFKVVFLSPLIIVPDGNFFVPVFAE